MTNNQYICSFLTWREENFYIHGNGKYYPKTSSVYFDVTKHIGKEKATEYHSVEEILEIFKKESTQFKKS